MARDDNDPKAAKKAAPTPPEDRGSDAQHPADSELRFQHVIRNMVVARDQARRKPD